MTVRLGKCFIKVRIHCLLYLNLAFFFTNSAIFLKLCDQMRFEVNCAKSHHHIISDGLQKLNNAWKKNAKLLLLLLLLLFCYGPPHCKLDIIFYNEGSSPITSRTVKVLKQDFQSMIKKQVRDLFKGHQFLQRGKPSVTFT